MINLRYIYVLIIISLFYSTLFSDQNKKDVLFLWQSKIDVNDSLLQHVFKMRYLSQYNFIDLKSFIKEINFKKKDSTSSGLSINEMLPIINDYEIICILFVRLNAYCLSGIKPDYDIFIKKDDGSIEVLDKYYKDTYIGIELDILDVDSKNKEKHIKISKTMNIDLKEKDIIYYIGAICDSINDTLNITLENTVN